MTQIPLTPYWNAYYYLMYFSPAKFVVKVSVSTMLESLSLEKCHIKNPFMLSKLNINLCDEIENISKTCIYSYV